MHEFPFWPFKGLRDMKPEWSSSGPCRECLMPTADETSKKIVHAKAVATEAQDSAARVQSQLRDMQRNLERWQGQFGGLRGQDLGQVVLDAGRSGELASRALGEEVGGAALSIALSRSVLPGEDAATTAGQAQPAGEPWHTQR